MRFDCTKLRFSSVYKMGKLFVLLLSFNLVQFLCTGIDAVNLKSLSGQVSEVLVDLCVLFLLVFSVFLTAGDFNHHL